MPSTVGTIDGSPEARSLSVTLLDASGDQRTVSVRIATGALVTEIDAFVVALAAATNASIFKVTVSDMYVGAESPSNALIAARSSSVYDNVVTLWTDIAGDRSENVFIPAPIAALFVDDTDNVDATATELTAVTDAFDDIKFGNAALKSLRYTERREINTRTKV